MIAQYKNLTRREYLWKMFEIIDCMQLDKNSITTNKEKEMMIEFLCVPLRYSYFRFSKHSKKYVRSIIEKKDGNVCTNQNMNNKIYSLMRKGLLYRDDEGHIRFKPYIASTVKKVHDSLSKGSFYDLKFRFRVTEDATDRYKESSTDDS